MSTQVSAVRSNRLLNAFVIAGDVLWLQLLFVVAALPIVTLFPAAVALQRSLREVLVEGRPKVTSVYWNNLLWALRQTWKVALLPPLFLAAAFVSLIFWLAADSAVGVAVLCFLAPLFGAALAGYVALLAASMAANREDPLRSWYPAAFSLAKNRAIPLAVSIVVMATWFILLAKLPTLVLVGTGLVPAGLAWWISTPWIREFRRNESH